MIFTKHFNRLKDLIEDHDFKQEYLATIFGMQRNQYRRYEAGESPLPLDLAKRLALFYNVSLDYIAGIITEPKKIFKDK